MVHIEPIALVPTVVGVIACFVAAYLLNRRRFIKPYIPIFLVLWGFSFVLDRLYYLYNEPLIAASFYSVSFFAFVFIAKAIVEPLRNYFSNADTNLPKTRRISLDPITFVLIYAIVMGFAPFLPDTISSERSVADWYQLSVIGFFVIFYVAFLWLFWKYWCLRKTVLNTLVLTSHKVEISLFIIGFFSFPIVLIFQYGNPLLPEWGVDIIVLVLTMLIVTPAALFAEHKSSFDPLFWAFSNTQQLALMKAAVEQSSEGMAIADMTSQIMLVNKSWCDMHGYEKSELVGGSLNCVYTGENLQEFETARGLLSARGSWSGEIYHTRKDGSAFPTLTTMSLLRDTRGQPIASLSISQDITEQKIMQEKIDQYSEHLEELVQRKTEELSESEKRYSVLFEEASDAILMVQDERTILANKKAAELQSYQKEEIVGFPLEKLVAGEYLPKMKEIYEGYMCGKMVSQVHEIELLDRTGKHVPIEFSGVSIKYQGRPAVLFVGRDITERKRIEEQRSRLEKLATVGELAAMVAHDLRNPLTSIRNACFYIKTECPLSANTNSQTALEMIDIIEQEITFANNIINDLLEFSTRKPLEKKPRDVNKIIRESLAKVDISKNIKIKRDFAKRAVANVDNRQLQRVFLNLIQNALNAMLNGGTLMITTKGAEDHIEIVVADTGIGISEENMSKIFQPLFTTKAKGIGLGLPICKKIVEEHGGTMSVESKAGQGTAIIIKLPK